MEFLVNTGLNNLNENAHMITAFSMLTSQQVDDNTLDDSSPRSIQESEPPSLSSHGALD